MAKIIRDEDVDIAAEGLHAAANAIRSFIETLGKNDPEPLRQSGLERADEYDRIAEELST